MCTTTSRSSSPIYVISHLLCNTVLCFLDTRGPRGSPQKHIEPHDGVKEGEVRTDEIRTEELKGRRGGEGGRRLGLDKRQRRSDMPKQEVAKRRWEVQGVRDIEWGGGREEMWYEG